MEESNLLKETVKAAKTVLKAPKRIVRYFPIQKIKEAVLMRVSEAVVTK